MLQPSLFGGETLPALVIQDDNALCTGGCGLQLQGISARQTPEGGMCARCVEDLYTECTDCGTLLRYDDWGECDNLRVGPDERHRCLRCNEVAYATCARCGDRIARDGGEIRINPNNPTEEYCSDCWASLWYNCETCAEVFSQRDAFRSPNGQAVFCEDCFNLSFFRCPTCGGSHSRDDARGWEGDPHCEGCYGNADTWKTQPWSGKASTFELVGSERCFGVELETCQCDDHRELHGKTEWGCVYECSTPGREFVSPILQGDEGFNEIRAMCRVAGQKRWSLDRSCGLHIHIDARDLSSEEMLQTVYAYRATYPLWKRFVSRRRSDNSMCGSPQYNLDDVREVEHIEDFVEARDRFEFVNWRAFLRHGSIEVRLYHGSLNAREICNWVALHARFIDAVKGMTFDEIDAALGRITRKNWSGLVDLIGDPNLLDYWRRKAKRQGNSLPALWNGKDDETFSDEDGDSEAFSHMELPIQEIRQSYRLNCGDPDCSICG
jgi:hypothetical protein